MQPLYRKKRTWAQISHKCDLTEFKLINKIVNLTAIIKLCTHAKVVPHLMIPKQLAQSFVICSPRNSALNNSVVITHRLYDHLNLPDHQNNIQLTIDIVNYAINAFSNSNCSLNSISFRLLKTIMLVIIL